MRLGLGAYGVPVDSVLVASSPALLFFLIQALFLGESTDGAVVNKVYFWRDVGGHRDDPEKRADSTRVRPDVQEDLTRFRQRIPFS